jgi:hypothetical protein
VREQEQSADTVRRAIARDKPGVQEHESEQRAAAREVPGVQEQEQSAPLYAQTSGYENTSQNKVQQQESIIMNIIN